MLQLLQISHRSPASQPFSSKPLLSCEPGVLPHPHSLASLTATVHRSLLPKLGQVLQVTWQLSIATLRSPTPPVSSSLLDLELLKYKVQALSVSKWPLWPRPTCVMERVRREAEEGGPSRDARLLSSTSSSTDEALPRGQLPPAACLSPDLAQKASGLTLPNPLSS